MTFDTGKTKYGITMLLALLADSASAAPPPPPCDPNLSPVTDLVGYQIREQNTRCEGFYISKVSAYDDPVLVGLMRGRLQFDPAKDRSLTITSPVTNWPVHLQGIAIPEKTYYRLDGLIAKGGSFSWNLSDVVNRGKLRAEDIGLYGFLVDAPTTFVPVEMGRGLTTTTTAWIRRSEAFVSVTWRSKEGNCGSAMAWSYPVNLTLPSSPGKPIEIPLPLTLSRELCLEVSALPGVGADWIRSRWHIRTSN